jgi:lysophospholipase L1-like esterase
MSRRATRDAEPCLFDAGCGAVGASAGRSRTAAGGRDSLAEAEARCSLCVARELDRIGIRDLGTVDASCGAAVIPNVVDTPQGTNPPQLTFVTPATKLVTVAVGGNDIDYNATAVECDNPATCTAPPNLAALVANMRVSLKAMIAKIKSAAPSATIVFVTYPREVPAGINCPALAFTDSGAAIVRSMGQMLENAFVQVVKPLKGVKFVDPYAVPGDHTVCAKPSQEWTQGAKYVFGVTGFAHHPTALGHKVMAQMIIKALGG